jgi:hypothetical protein
MDRERSPFGRPVVLDVVLGVVIALSLTSIAGQVRTFAAIRTIDSLGRLSLLAAALLFAALYWIETHDTLRRMEMRVAAADPHLPPTHPLRNAVSFGVVALLTLMIAFASVESLGWFLGVSAALWLIDLVAEFAVRQRATSLAVPETEDVAIPFRFLVQYSGINFVIFAALTVWNAVAPWSERVRGAAGITLLAFVLFRHIVWRPRGLRRR